jgi:hypothetical protein
MQNTEHMTLAQIKELVPKLSRIDSRKLSDTEKYERQRLQNIIRVRERREKGGDALKELRREKLKQFKESVLKLLPTISPPHAVEEEIIDEAPMPPAVKVHKLKLKKKSKALLEQEAQAKREEEELKAKQSIKTIDDLKNAFKEDPNITEFTLKTNITSLNRLYTITQCQDIIQCLNQSDKIIKEINSGQYTKGKNKELHDYSISAKLAVYQVILKIKSMLNLDLPHEEEYKEQYKNFIEMSQIDTSKISKEKAEDRLSYTKEYLPKILKTFKKPSKEYLIAKLFSEIPARDNYQLIVILKPEDETDKTKNYILISNPKSYKVIINKYKTVKKFKPFDKDLSLETTKLLQEFLKKNEIKEKDYIFGSNSLSAFVINMNHAIGIDGKNMGTNENRKMYSTENYLPYEDEDTPEETLNKVKSNVKLANDLKHSTDTQKRTYVGDTKKGKK